MKPTVHFYPKKPAAFTADNAASRLLFSTSLAQWQPMRYLDIESLFTTENFAHDKPFYVRKIQTFDGTYRNPDRQVGKLLFNLYGTKNFCYNYR